MSRSMAVQWLVVLLTVVSVVAAGATYVNASTQRTIAESRRASQEQGRQSLAIFCSMVVAQDDVLNDPDNPPMTERARNNADAWHKLRMKFCG